MALEAPASNLLQKVDQVLGFPDVGWGVVRSGWVEQICGVEGDHAPLDRLRQGGAEAGADGDDRVRGVAALAEVGKESGELRGVEFRQQDRPDGGDELVADGPLAPLIGEDGAVRPDDGLEPVVEVVGDG